MLDLVGGGERERDLVRRERGEQPLGDELVDDLGLDLPAAGSERGARRASASSWYSALPR